MLVVLALGALVANGVSAGADQASDGADGDAKTCDGDAETCTAKAASSTANAAGTASPLCGDWCRSAEGVDGRPCRMDQALMPCRGEWCITTCQMWTSFMLNDLQTFNVSCDNFARFYGFPRGAEVCKPECVLPEIRSDRYPAPTGLGLLCRPGTCEAGTQSRYANDAKNIFPGLGVLTCPCNWFGSDCRDDWAPVRAIEKEVVGDFHVTRFKVDEGSWHRIMANHQPGGVVRVQHVDSSGVAREQPYALFTDKDGVVGILEVLAGAPQSGMHPAVVEVANRVRAHEGGAVSSLYINPSVAGFFNKRFTFLMDALMQPDSVVKHVVVVSAGSGLSGALSAINRIFSSSTLPLPQLHLYHGVRHVRDLPYRQQLKTLEKKGMKLTLVLSSKDSDGDGDFNHALGRGIHLSALAAGEQSFVSPFMTVAKKAYVQHAVGMDLAEGYLKRAGASMKSTAVVVCGRIELLRETPLILASLCHEQKENGSECADFMEGRVFTNI